MGDGDDLFPHERLITEQAHGPSVTGAQATGQTRFWKAGLSKQASPDSAFYRDAQEDLGLGFSSF